MLVVDGGMAVSDDAIVDRSDMAVCGVLYGVSYYFINRSIYSRRAASSAIPRALSGRVCDRSRLIALVRACSAVARGTAVVDAGLAVATAAAAAGAGVTRHLRKAACARANAGHALEIGDIDIRDAQRCRAALLLFRDRRCGATNAPRPVREDGRLTRRIRRQAAVCAPPW